MAGRQYGLVVYGASGYTGRESVAHLGRRASQIGLSWAIAGRSRQKLEEVAAASPGPPPGIIVAEGAERKTLSALAQSGEVVISWSGPMPHSATSYWRSA